MGTMNVLPRFQVVQSGSIDLVEVIPHMSVTHHPAAELSVRASAAAADFVSTPKEPGIAGRFPLAAGVLPGDDRGIERGACCYSHVRCR